MSRELFNEIYSTRLLVFIESEPQSNKYQQVILTPKQFKEVSDDISLEGDKLRLSKEIYKLPDLREV
tara:strand:+ start:410 stop:610 length:201 start_codon:yes stop_codon:yes gene_type:complete